jgi:predicted amidohydrolase YtcJ
VEPPASIFVARGFVTLNRRIPQATHMAVREGRILGLGGAELLERKPTC